MAQAIPGFDATTFRDGIHQAMRMALPNDPARWPKFVIPASTPPAGDVDVDGVPWDLEGQADVSEPTVVQDALCAIEAGARGEHTRHFGPLQPGHAEMTFLDVDWAKVEGFDHVWLYPTSGAPVRYEYRRVLLSTNLDVVGVTVVEVAAEDVA